jgi:hypothetical protein
MKTTVITALAVLVITGQAFAVDRLVPSQYATIQAAIDAAVDGDTVLVSPGTYSPISLTGKSLAVRGLGASGSIVIDAAGLGRAVDASNVVTGTATLENLVIRNAVLSSSEGPVGGAGIDAVGSRLNLVGVRIESCSATWTGVGMFLTQGAGIRAINSALSIDRCSFARNVTTANNLGSSYSQGTAYGSAVAVRGGSLSVRDSDFVDNSATATTTGTSWHDVQARGAAIYAEAAVVSIESSRFSRNSCSATQFTSAVASCQAMGGGLFVLPSGATTTTVKHSVFTDNSITSRSATTYDPINYNATHGGAICVAGNVRIEDCSILRNTAAGGLQADAETLGGGIFMGLGSLELVRCEISENSGGVSASAGVRAGGGLAISGGAAVLSGTTICGNSFDQTSIQASGSISEVDGTCIQASCASCAPPCVGDLTANRNVDGADLGALLAFWGPRNAVFPQADINGDGTVNGADLGLLLANWGPCPN